jgi:hypothetical protein
VEVTPPVVDHGNDSYSFRLLVAPRFAAGGFRLTVVLIFRNFEGLKFSSARFKHCAELRRIPLLFWPGNASLPMLETCRGADFARDAWSNRWTWLAKKDDCEDVDATVRRAAGALESNGWVYLAHCSFKLFQAEAEWSASSSPRASGPPPHATATASLVRLLPTSRRRSASSACTPRRATPSVGLLPGRCTLLSSSTRAGNYRSHAGYGEEREFAGKGGTTPPPMFSGLGYGGRWRSK